MNRLNASLCERPCYAIVMPNKSFHPTLRAARSGVIAHGRGLICAQFPRESLMTDAPVDGYVVLREGQTVQLFLGDSFVQDLPNWAVARQHVRAILCPKCLQGGCLGAWEPTGPFTFDAEDTPGGLDAFQDLDAHIAECRPPFPHDGVRVVKTPEQIAVAEELSKWSRREARWDAPLFSQALIESTGTALVYVHDEEPRGYGVFNTLDFQPDRGRTSYVEDLYTFPNHRRTGVAERIMNEALERLPFKDQRIGVSFPVRREAQRLLSKVARRVGGDIMAVRRDGWFDLKLQEFDEVAPYGTER